MNETQKTTMTDAPTPATDAEEFFASADGGERIEVVDSDFAHRLGRLRDEWRACAKRLAKELREYDEVLSGGLSTRNALAEFDRLSGKEGA